jgi:hypothetical protein
MDEQTLEIFRRDYKTFKVTVKDSDGVVVDLTDYDAKFTAKLKSTDTDAQAKIGPIDGTITTPATGVISFTLTSTDTNIPAGTYFFDVQISKTGDVKTVAYGKLIIIQDITVTIE